jgi:hypothetical protein
VYAQIVNNYVYVSSGLSELWRANEAEKDRLDRYVDRLILFNLYCALPINTSEQERIRENARYRASFLDTAATYQLVASDIEPKRSESQRRLCHAQKYLELTRRHIKSESPSSEGSDWQDLDKIMNISVDRIVPQHSDLLQSVISRKLQAQPADLCARFS